MNKGFTLLEMLIAVALVGILLTALVGIGIQFSSHLQENRKHAKQVQEIYAALDLIEIDLSSYLKNFEGAGPWFFHFVAEDDRPWDHGKISGERHIGYEALEEDGQTTLYRVERDAYIQNQGLRTPILTTQKINIVYLNDQLAGFPLWPKANKRSPAAIQITLTDNKNKDWQRTIPLVVRTGYVR